VVSGLPGGNVEVVAGTNAGDATVWDYISDANQVPVGVFGTGATASGSSITIPFTKTYSRVIRFICGPDETLANAIGMTCGASVGLDSAIIKASTNQTLAFRANWDGAAWVTSGGTGQSGGGSFRTLTSVTTGGDGAVTIDHSYLPGIDVSVTPYNVNGSVVPKMPAIRSVANTATILQFYEAGAADASVDTRFAFYFRKRWMGGINLDGTDDWPLDLGNIWFFGIFEV
jgi:hypothetical protein